MSFRFWINSLGEYGRDMPDGTLDIGGGTVEISDIPQYLSVAKRDALVEERFAKQRQDYCSERELALLAEHDRHGEAIAESARWRVNAGIDYEKFGTRLWQTTEFKHFADDEPFWTQLRQIASAAGGEVEEFWTETERGHWQSPPPGLDLRSPEARKHPSYVPAEHEGRELLQVSVDFDIHGKSPDLARQIRERFDSATGDLWEKAGVGVL